MPDGIVDFKRMTPRLAGNLQGALGTVVENQFFCQRRLGIGRRQSDCDGQSGQGRRRDALDGI